jgi:tetratricopeptide (TPR) repeat protein
MPRPNRCTPVRWRWRASGRPAHPQALRRSAYLALSLNRFGDALREQKRYDDAVTAYQEALAVRHRLAEAEPDDPQRQIDLIAAHTNLFVLASARDDKAQVAHVSEAQRIYNALPGPVRAED